MTQRIKPNRYKKNQKEGEGSGISSEASVDFCLKCIMFVAFLSILSLGAIFAHDFIVQSRFFNIREIHITGADKAAENEILELAGLNEKKNIFALNLSTAQKKIVSHPWIESAKLKRKLPYSLNIDITEQKAIAIVKVENLSDILINATGRPFKEYNPLKDKIGNLPVITGVELGHSDDSHIFKSPLYNSILDFLNSEKSESIKGIKADRNTGITVETSDIFNPFPLQQGNTIQIKLGFDHYSEKLKKAVSISGYIVKNFPERTICSMDFYDIEKIFIKTKMNETLHNNLKKGA